MFYSKRDNMKRLSILLAAAVVILTGCAVGNTHSYDQAVPAVNATSGINLGLGVQDVRVYVLDKNKPESFVGVTRGGYGNPFDVNTTNGKPLADNVAISLKKALESKGAKINVVALPLGMSKQDAIKTLSQKSPKSILVTISEFKSDTYINTKFDYSVRVDVYQDGQLLATKRVEGPENLGGNFIDPFSHAREVLPPAYKKIFRELLTSPEIAKHL